MTTIKNIVLEGGGMKGISYGGALLELENHIDMSKVENYAGTSAGAIVAVALASGYTPKQIAKMVTDLDYTEFEDNSFGFLRDMYRFMRNFGWNKGESFLNWCGGLLQGQGLPHDATFHQLFLHTGKKLYLTGTNISSGKKVVFSVDRCPHFSVAVAARISMSIPFFFAAVRINGERYADGGLLNNYPIRLFDVEKYVVGNFSEKPLHNPYTLGLRVDSQEEIDNDHQLPNKTNNIFSYTTAVMTTIYNSLQNSHVTHDDWRRTVCIPTGSVSTTDFSMEQRTKEFLVQQGAQAVRNYFSGTAHHPSP